MINVAATPEHQRELLGTGVVGYDIQKWRHRFGKVVGAVNFAGDLGEESVNVFAAVTRRVLRIAGAIVEKAGSLLKLEVPLASNENESVQRSPSHS